MIGRELAMKKFHEQFSIFKMLFEPALQVVDS
jgi:hypothetical protein